MLELTEVVASYGQSQILNGISLAVGAGEVVSIMGRNGMGKSTTVRSIMGLKAVASGRINFDGTDITNCVPHRIAHAGIGLVPEGRRIFPNLSVEENLLATARANEGPGRQWTLEKVFEYFPRLKERLRNMGSQLSGGEQQMLAIGRALMTNPKLIILDEATEGLAPLIRKEIWACLNSLKAQGQSILVIDKHLHALRQLADRHFVVEKGRVVWSGNSDDLARDRHIVEVFLGIAKSANT